YYITPLIPRRRRAGRRPPRRRARRPDRAPLGKRDGGGENLGSGLRQGQAEEQSTFGDAGMSWPPNRRRASARRHDAQNGIRRESDAYQPPTLGQLGDLALAGAQALLQSVERVIAHVADADRALLELAVPAADREAAHLDPFLHVGAFHSRGQRHRRNRR